MSWCRAVWLENGIEEEFVIPSCWVKEDFVYWPSTMNVLRAAEEKLPPDETWLKFKLVKIKVQDDDKYLCNEYNFTDDDRPKVTPVGIKKKPKIKQKSAANSSTTLTYPSPDDITKRYKTKKGCIPQQQQQGSNPSPKPKKELGSSCSSPPAMKKPTNHSNAIDFHPNSNQGACNINVCEQSVSCNKSATKKKESTPVVKKVKHHDSPVTSYNQRDTQSKSYEKEIEFGKCWWGFVPCGGQGNSFEAYVK